MHRPHQPSPHTTAAIDDEATDLPGAAVLNAPPAPFALDLAQALLRQHYGLQAQFSPLSGERDANFLVTPEHGPRAMLKISHPLESPLVADFQTQALRHLAQSDPSLPVQRLWPTLDGADAVLLPCPGGQTRVMRLFSYLEGLPMPQAPRSAAQRASVAQALARLDRALAGLQHPASTLALPWDIQYAHRARGLLRHVPDPARRALAARALDAFETQALPRLAGLRRQAIHNDFNIYNLLVDPAAPERLSGILDLGDMVHAPLVDDLAVAASYQIEVEGDALGTIADFCAAYHAVLPLQSAELQALPALIRARLAMVVAISGWRAARQPDNAPYLLRNNPISWARLQALDGLDPVHASAVLHQACGLPLPSF
ncbi:phosphotransferase [Curvibacter sp. RS43]|uniref:phosphotransferase n=1 Tax=Curvibacter microcysteis TaxID=3026419 RepID=UPI00235EAFD8|nr:phosphotransferase [Curvibacter sp. RS43]MDD0809097.1 phosphotransferase [Curvibacter sp. RS43]